MEIKVNDTYVDVHFKREQLAKELIKEVKRCCKCNFDRDQELYDELVELIKERKKEPIDLSCIE